MTGPGLMPPGPLGPLVPCEPEAADPWVFLLALGVVVLTLAVMSCKRGKF